MTKVTIAFLSWKESSYELQYFEFDMDLHLPFFAEHGKTSMVWWMLAVAVNPWHSLHKGKNCWFYEVDLIDLCLFGLPHGVCLCPVGCVGVCTQSVGDEESTWKDASAWIGAVWYADGAKVRDGGKKTFPSLCHNGTDQESLSTEHGTKPPKRNKWNLQRNEASMDFRKNAGCDIS